MDITVIHGRLKLGVAVEDRNRMIAGCEGQPPPASTPPGRRPKCCALCPLWKTLEFTEWKKAPFRGPKSLRAEGLLALPCANFLMQSRSALTLMPQYKLKVFFRLRYMIIIGLPIISFIKQRDKGKSRPGL